MVCCHGRPAIYKFADDRGRAASGLLTAVVEAHVGPLSSVALAALLAAQTPLNVCRAGSAAERGATLASMSRQPFDLLDILPAAPHGIVLDFNWSRPALWDLKLPVEQMPVADLRWLLTKPVWSFEGAHFKVSPPQVRREPGTSPRSLRPGDGVRPGVP
jgi:hypothetical protein